MTQNYKIVLIGDSAVGKTSIINFAVSGQFINDSNATISPLNQEVSYNIENTEISLKIWDTAGQEQFRSLTPTFVRGSSAVIIVYSCNDQSSFNSVKSWYDFASNHLESAENFLYYLVENKCDLLKTQQNGFVPENEGNAKAKSFGMKFFKTSAKEGTNITELFTTIANDCFIKGDPNHKKSILDDDNRKNKDNNCCYLIYLYIILIF